MTFDVEEQSEETSVLVVIGDTHEDGITLEAESGRDGRWVIRLPAYRSELMDLREAIDKALA